MSPAAMRQKLQKNRSTPAPIPVPTSRPQQGGQRSAAQTPRAPKPQNLLQAVQKAAAPVVTKLQAAQQQFRQATQFLQPVENLVEAAAAKSDYLPTEVAGTGAAVLAQRAGVPPAALLPLGLLTGGLSFGRGKPKPIPVSFEDQVLKASLSNDPLSAYSKLYAKELKQYNINPKQFKSSGELIDALDVAVQKERASLGIPPNQRFNQLKDGTWETKAQFDKRVADIDRQYEVEANLPQKPAPIPNVSTQVNTPNPIPNRSTKVSVDPVDRLLMEREQDYQGALQIFRNDVLEREAGLNRLKGIGAADEVADEALSSMVSSTRRARRDAVSERGSLFEDDLLNYAIGNDKNPVDTINKTETRQRQISQPIPGTQAHHPASVSSTEALVQNMNEHEIRKLWDIAAENGYPVGSLAENFIPLSGPAHVTGGKNWGPDFAHVGRDGKTPDPGRFKTEALPKGTNAEQAWKFLQPVLEEQRVLNDRAYNHPVETRMRADAEATVGRPIEWRGPVTPSRAASNKNAKGAGVNATAIAKSYDRNPGLLKSKEVPNVTIAVPGVGKVPISLGKPKRIPRRGDNAQR